MVNRNSYKIDIVELINPFLFVLFTGIRYINDCFTRILAIKLGRSYTPSIPMTSTPVTTHIDSRPLSYMTKKTIRYHPYP
jgi:hypothetical protein